MKQRQTGRGKKEGREKENQVGTKRREEEEGR